MMPFVYITDHKRVGSGIASTSPLFLYEISLWHFSPSNKYSCFLACGEENAFSNAAFLIFSFLRFFKVRTDLNLYGKLNCVLSSESF